MTLSAGYLFGEEALFQRLGDTLQLVSETQRRDQVGAEILKISDDILLYDDIENIAVNLVEKYTFHVPVLEDTQPRLNPIKKRFWLSKVHSLIGAMPPVFGDVEVELWEIEVLIKFTGDRNLFSYKPSSYDFNLPQARLRENVLSLYFISREFNASEAILAAQSRIEKINLYLERQRETVKNYNDSLIINVSSRLRARQNELWNVRDQLSAIGQKVLDTKKAAEIPIMGDTDSCVCSLMVLANRTRTPELSQ